MRDKTLKRMLKLADIKPIIKESKETLLSSMEIVKKSVDGNTYAIVRENKKYFIKSTKTKENLKESDFDYIGGIQNKTKKSFNSFSDVTKHLNLMFEEINNHSNVDNVNILESDFLNEKNGNKRYGEKNTSSLSLDISIGRAICSNKVLFLFSLIIISTSLGKLSIKSSISSFLLK